jgi:hypothetical protein
MRVRRLRLRRTGPAKEAESCLSRVSLKTAIMCSVGEIAADTFTAFGEDDDRINSDYGQRLIHESGCVLIHDAIRFRGDIQRVRSVRIAEPDGSVRALFLGMMLAGQNYNMWVPEAYLTGICPRSVPSDYPVELYKPVKRFVPTDTIQILCKDKAALDVVRSGVLRPDSISDNDFERAIEGGGCVSHAPDSTGPVP